MYKMESEDVLSLYDQANLYKSLDQVVDLMLRDGDKQIIIKLYNRYFDAAYGEMQKKYHFEV